MVHNRSEITSLFQTFFLSICLQIMSFIQSEMVCVLEANASVVVSSSNEFASWVRSQQQSGRAVSQAVSRWLPTAAVRVRARVWSSIICGGRSGAGADFLRVFRFLLPIIIPPHSLSSQPPGAGTVGHKWPTCRVDPVWTPPPTIRIKKD
jgi:hypothetical protein